MTSSLLFHTGWSNTAYLSRLSSHVNVFLSGPSIPSQCSAPSLFFLVAFYLISCTQVGIFNWKGLHLLLFLFCTKFLQSCAGMGMPAWGCQHGDTRMGMPMWPSQGYLLKREATSGLGNSGNFYKRCFLEERGRLDVYQYMLSLEANPTKYPSSGSCVPWTQLSTHGET